MDNYLRYENIKKISEDEVDSLLCEGDPEKLLIFAISISMYGSDLSVAQSVCLTLSGHENFNVRGNALIGFGHLARRFGKLNRELVLPAIEKGLLSENKYVKGQAWAAADDVSNFLGWEVEGFDEG